MTASATNDAAVLALRALTATLSDERLGQRFLSLSGFNPPELRQRAAQPTVLAALLRFLEDHEPDLLSIAAAIDVEPRALVSARHELER